MENNGYFYDLIHQFAHLPTSEVAFSTYDGKCVENISRPQFSADILKKAGYFKHHNISGQHIGLIANNSYEWITTFFSIIASGNVVVLLNPALSSDVLCEMCKKADVSMIWSDGSVDASFQPESCNARWLSADEMNKAFPMHIDDVHPAQPDETIILLATSGTTGKSKIVEYSMENVQSYLADVQENVVLSGSMLLAVPMHHILGLVAVLSKLQLLETVCIGRGVRYMIMDMPILNPEFVPMVPSVLESLVKLLRKAKTPEDLQKYTGKHLSSISVGGASVKLDLCRYMMQLGIQVQSAYGMTETTGAGTWCVWDENTLGSIGKSYGRTQCRIEDGELLFKGPAVIKGYYKDPEETAKVIVDGWLHTGDIGYCNEDGYYYITGRKKNVIILSNGENVNPEEIEAILASYEAIEECLVYSDGKGICADIFTKDQNASAAFVKQYNEGMPMYRQIYKATYTAEPLPKTGSGKIKRKENK